ncbi:hypothetical protein [Desulfovibrio cuneatus]|uniref:hypothetical protein n=1 Tax=Desulfovibrio cuneatus TaxID=159728 RepID=UPI0003F7B01B|nr:hypothetical protein [Desulfovibrio cuneatus]
MYHHVIRQFLCIVLAALGVGSGMGFARAAGQELRTAQNRGNAVEMQVGPNTTHSDDDSADTMRVGPGSNRSRNANRNENNRNLYPNFANDVRVEVQIQPDMPFWHWGQTRPDNSLPPATPMAPERRR